MKIALFVALVVSNVWWASHERVRVVKTPADQAEMASCKAALWAAQAKLDYVEH